MRIKSLYNDILLSSSFLLLSSSVLNRTEENFNVLTPFLIFKNFMNIFLENFWENLKVDQAVKKRKVWANVETLNVFFHFFFKSWNIWHKILNFHELLDRFKPQLFYQQCNQKNIWYFKITEGNLVFFSYSHSYNFVNILRYICYQHSCIVSSSDNLIRKYFPTL